MIGTDYNDKIPGVGPKTALKLIKKHGTFEEVIAEKKYDVDIPIDEVRKIFLDMSDVDIPTLEWVDPDGSVLRKILCTEHDFNEDRINSSLGKLEKALEELRGSTQQSSLDDFF